MATTAFLTDFVPADIDATDWGQLEPLVRSLLERPIASASELEQWLIDRGELESAVGEARADLYIATACDTENEQAEKAFESFIEEIPPKLQPLLFELDKRCVELLEQYPLPADRFTVLTRSKRTAVRLFRPENIPLHTELAKMSQEHGRITGAQTVQFEGREQTIQQMARYLERPDRSIREQAWRAISSRRMQDRERLDTLLSRMVAKRDAVARNADCADYIDYTFLAKERFDYTPADCEAYWKACEAHVVPLMRRMDEQRRQTMGLDSLRPWDLAVDPRGRGALSPFEGGRDLFAKTMDVMRRLDPRLAEMLGRMHEDGDAGSSGGNGVLRTRQLDLDSRKGKRPGGFQYERERSREPFIFMNAAGVHRDVITMIHEAGHAFHSMLCAIHDLSDHRNYPIEFAEVASMSMEHLTRPHWGGPRGFYPDEEDLARAQREHLEHCVSTLAWIACIDAFQHWMYRNPNHTPEQRDAYWLTLDDRFGHTLDYTGLEAERTSAWQRQTHLFTHPMYYIEYGIAELGALQLWLRSVNEGEKVAVDAYINAMRLGGMKTIPELFAAAGLKFDFGAGTVQRLVEAVEQELERLPA